MSLRRIIFILLYIAPFFVIYNSWSQTGRKGNKSIPKLFESDQILKMTLRSDFNYILSYRDEDREYKNADLIFEDENGFHKVDLKVTSRGHFRRDSMNCDFPPLMLNFKKKSIENTIFEGQNKLKLVTHCKSAYPEFIQYLFREYYVYRAYNLITDFSFRVRIIKILYEDINGAIPSKTWYAFLIEDIDGLANRLNMDEIDEKINLTNLEPYNAVTLAVFEFMIGNTDWIISFRKNVEIIGYDNLLIAIPYDFDYTGAVGIDYTQYGSSFPLTPEPRQYKGLCYDKKTFKKIFIEFLDQRKAVLKDIRKSILLDQASKDHMIEYYNEFYNILRSKSQKEVYFFNICKEDAH